MDPLLSIDTFTPAPVVNIGANAATPSYGALAAGLGLSALDTFNNTSTIVAFSGIGQLLSVTATFQDTLRALQPGTATSGGGQSFGADFASLAAETQSLVDTFNNLQQGVAGINGTGNLFGAGVPGAAELIQALNTQIQANYSNGNSPLTALSQLGVTFQPSLVPGGVGTLRLDLGTLREAYNTNAAGAFALLGEVASALSGVANNFVNQGGSQYAALNTLASGLTNAWSGGIWAQPGGSIALPTLLASGSLAGNPNLQQAILALNEYTQVSSLLG